MDLGLRQRDVAEQLGTCAESVRNWERGHTEPAFASWPAVIDFLGFVPFPVGQSLSDQIRAWRTVHGVSRSRLATMVGADESTVWRADRRSRGAFARGSIGRRWNTSITFG